MVGLGCPGSGRGLRSQTPEVPPVAPTPPGTRSSHRAATEMAKLQQLAQTPSAGLAPSLFVQLGLDVLYSGIGADELQVYAVLLDKSWKTGDTHITNAEIGGLIGKSSDTVWRVLKKLEARGLVVRTEIPAT